MEILCTKRCLDKNGDEYTKGGIYHYYDNLFVYDTLGNKLFDIYDEDTEDERVHMGLGSLQFIKDNFYLKDFPEDKLNKILCIKDVRGGNGRQYYNGKEYYYKLDNRKYCEGDDKIYNIYITSDERTWIGYIKYSFIKKNFIEWVEYESYISSINNLFNNIMV